MGTQVRSLVLYPAELWALIKTVWSEDAKGKLATIIGIGNYYLPLFDLGLYKYTVSLSPRKRIIPILLINERRDLSRPKRSKLFTY